MTIRTKLICLGGPLHGKHVEIDPLLNSYRCEVLEDDLGPFDTSLADRRPVKTTRHEYIRRTIVIQRDFAGNVANTIDVLIVANMTVHEALVKVFDYD